MSVDNARDSQAANECGTQGFVRIEGLQKSFGPVKVVSDLDLTIRQGEFVSLLGPSGCGKTTTLRMIAGFTSPDGGQIIVDGLRIDQVPSHKRGMAMVFQNYALFPHMTVGENVAFGLRMHKVERSEINRKLDEVLDLVRLRQFINRYPSELSGGQQQRVALARAIILQPKVLLLDEPLSNLDAKLRKELRSDFLEIRKIAEITTLFVTHDLEEAFSVSDRVAVMNAGKLEQYASPVEIFTRPATSFVAEFIGHSNVIEGVLESSRTGIKLRHKDIDIEVGFTGTVGARIRAAIPAHLIRIGSQPLDLDNSFRGRLHRRVYLGPLLQLDIDMSGTTLHSETPATTDMLQLKLGDEMYIGWQRNDLIPLPGGKPS